MLTYARPELRTTYSLEAGDQLVVLVDRLDDTKRVTRTWRAVVRPDSPVKKRAPSYSDEHLSRYREQRLREENRKAGLAARTPKPAPQDGEPEGVEAGGSEAPPAPPPAPVSVALQDLNGTLPAEARDKAEAAALRFVKFFQVPVDGPLVIPLRYFPEDGGYRDHLVRNVRDDVNWRGYYDPILREIVVGGGEDFFSILLHEVNHFIVGTAFEKAPIWLTEGLAEYFEASSATPEGLIVMDQPHHRRHLAEWIRKGRQPDLRELLAASDWTSLGAGTSHDHTVRALSWSVVDLLMRQPEGRQMLLAIMARLEERGGLHSLEAFDRIFPGGAVTFERQWLAHVEARAQPD